MKMMKLASLVLFVGSMVMAAQLPQGTFQGVEIVRGNGFGSVVPAGKCVIRIQGNQAVTSFTGSWPYNLNEIHPGVFLGVSGEKAVFIQLDSSGSVQSFGTETLIGGQPTPTAQDRICMMNLR